MPLFPETEPQSSWKPVENFASAVNLTAVAGLMNVITNYRL